jgi:nitroimidazol reductase NimA-like FMN-containing flavoprotein (pyridoxamine 5'-phosphate oxidase superfamily)
MICDEQPGAGIRPCAGSTPFGSLWIDQRGSEVLERAESIRLLALAAGRGGIGRLGFPTGRSPVIVPVNFGYDDEEVLLRVGPGTIAEVVPGLLVAFEVDEVDPEAGAAWSVLVRGLARLLGEDELHRLREKLPEPLAPEPGDVVISVRADVVTGRRFGLPTR